VHIQKIDPNNVANSSKELKKLYNEDLYKDFDSKNTIITTTAFDFNAYRLFCATYNKNKKQTIIYKIHLRKTLGFNDIKRYPDSSSDEND
jgi:hypothetical protein